MYIYISSVTLLPQEGSTKQLSSKPVCLSWILMKTAWVHSKHVKHVSFQWGKSLQNSVRVQQHSSLSKPSTTCILANLDKFKFHSSFGPFLSSSDIQCFDYNQLNHLNLTPSTSILDPKTNEYPLKIDAWFRLIHFLSHRIHGTSIFAYMNGW